MHTPEARKHRWRELWIFLAAALVVAIPAARQLADHQMNPTVLLRVGSDSASRSFVEADFDETVLTEDYGHDGQQFYVIASTFPELGAAQGHVDHLRYRARRILLPALASPAPEGPALVWSMFAINLLAVGAAAVGVGRLASRLGGTAWLGLAVAVTPAMAESVQGGLGDALAFAFAIWGVVVWRRHGWWAALLFFLAALSRETALVAPLACLVVAPRQRVLALLAPIAGFGAWVVAVAVWLPATAEARSNLVADAVSQFTTPFAGWAKVGWANDAVVLGGILLATSLVSAWVLRKRMPEVSVWLLLEGGLLILANEGVVFRPLNFARVAPLAIAAAALAVVEYRHRPSGDPVAVLTS